MLSLIAAIFSTAMWGMIPVAIVILLAPLAGYLLLWLVVGPLYIAFTLLLNLLKMLIFGLIWLVCLPFSHSARAQSQGLHQAMPALPVHKN